MGLEEPRKSNTMVKHSTPNEYDVKPGEYVLRQLFAQFATLADKKIDAVLTEPLEKPLAKSLQRGEDATFDDLITSLGQVAEQCLPSLLKTLFSWLDLQLRASADTFDQRSIKTTSSCDSQSKATGKNQAAEAAERAERYFLIEKRDLAVEFIFCLVLIEVLKQLHLHPGHEDLITHIEILAFKHFKFRQEAQSGPNVQNTNMIADLYAEVIGVLATSRFQSVRKRFMAELKELRSKEPSPLTTHSIISLLMGMKFFRIKMAPIEEFEASFQFMHECAQYFLEVKDRDIKHALAGLFVEILVPVAACVKNEVNVPCLKNFVEILYRHTLDLCTKKKHSLALFPLTTCLLCVSQKSFFLQNWHCFVAMCLSNLKNKDPKMCRVALESLYRLLWVYMIRIKCESNTATQSRLHSIVNSLFPKGSKAVVPRDTPLNIFVKIIQFIAQERLDFAMKEIVFDLLSVHRPIKIILTPERMSIGLRAFLVVADSLQQKEGEPPMPRTLGVLPSGNTLRVKKTFLNKMLTEEMARSIGVNHYYPYVKRALNDILRALDLQFGRPLMMTTVQNINKEPDDMITGERKPKIDLFRTCVAAVPRLIPEGMSRHYLIDLLSRLTVHMDEEMRGLACQSLQNIIVDFPDWREDVIEGFIHFILNEINDTFPQLLDNSLRILLQFLTTWKNSLQAPPSHHPTSKAKDVLNETQKLDHLSNVMHYTEATALVFLCSCRQPARRLSAHILKETRYLERAFNLVKEREEPVADVIDRVASQAVTKAFPFIPSSEKSLIQSNTIVIDLQWLAERQGAAWISGQNETEVGSSTKSLNQTTGSSCDSNLEEQLNKLNAWSACLVAFMDEVMRYSTSSVQLSWPLVCQRLNALYPQIEPIQVSDNRAASLFPKSSSIMKRSPSERDNYLALWKSYLIYASKIAPQSATNHYIVSARFVLHDLSSSPDSLVSERSESNRSPLNRGISASGLFKQMVPLLRNEQADIRNAVICGLTQVNSIALSDLIEELGPLIRESIERKQENMRRRKRREEVRKCLGRLLYQIAEKGTLGSNPCVLDQDTAGSLNGIFIEYIDGIRVYLETENDKDPASSVQDIKRYFCYFISKLIKSFPIDSRASLLTRDLRRNLFNLFASWCPHYCPISSNTRTSSPNSQTMFDSITTIDTTCEIEYAALEGMSCVLTCGAVFEPNSLSEESPLYSWLTGLLGSKDERIREIGLECVILLLEYNPDHCSLLDWLVDCCYTKSVAVADGCFTALATIFCLREYPCDRYVAIINVTLLYTGCPRTHLRQLAFQLMQILDHRFFAPRENYSSLKDVSSEDYEGEPIEINFPKEEPVKEESEPEIKEPETKTVTIEEPEVQLRKKRRPSERNNLNTNAEPLFFALYPCNQIELIKRMAALHPELTMPIFSEITCRFQTGRPSVCQNLLECLVPWLYNMELVDSHVPPPVNPLTSCRDDPSENEEEARKEGWGSAEATEMVLNNLFYMTVKLGDEYPREMEAVWGSLWSFWPNNIRITMRYLFIITALCPNELLSYAKRVVLLMARAQPERLLDELMSELQTVETLNCVIERTATPPFYRITSLRKASGHCEEDNGAETATGHNHGSQASLEASGTLHTKRHSTESGAAPSNALAELDGKMVNPTSGIKKFDRIDDYGPFLPAESAANFQNIFSRISDSEALLKPETPQPHPLPMPEFGGYYAPLTEYLPDASQPVASFHRCNLALIVLTDIVADGIGVDWSPHIPLMLHIIFLGLDHTRNLIHEHCKQLLLNMLVVLGHHQDNLSVGRILLNAKTDQLDFGLPTINSTTRPLPDFVNPSHIQRNGSIPSNSGVTRHNSLHRNKSSSLFTPFSQKQEKGVEEQKPCSGEMPIDLRTHLPLDEFVKALIEFLATKKGHLWNYEDITAKVWSIRSAEQLAYFLENVLFVFKESMPAARIEERWAEVSLQLALSCSSRHYAGRSLQIFRALKIPANSRMLTDILSRLVETVAEQGEDMQGYVTELMLTLETAVDLVDSDQRISELVREYFKSTPNLNAKEIPGNRKSAPPQANGPVVATAYTSSSNLPTSSSMNASFKYAYGHTRSTSYSMSTSGKRPPTTSESPVLDSRDSRTRSCTEPEGNKNHANESSALKMNFINNGNLGRSRSAQSLKNLEDRFLTPEDRTSLLAQFFWIAVAMLETDYEHEFLLALRLLDKVLTKFPLDRSDCQDKAEKLASQMKWHQFKGVHAMLLKGCTSPLTFDSTMLLLYRMTPCLEIPIVDPSESVNSFPFNVMALLPYLLMNYDDPNVLCIQAAENIARWCSEKTKKLENLATVMNLYSRRAFSKESFQWTKCVVKYLYDSYSHAFLDIISFLVEVLERGPASVQSPVLTILYCILNYIDTSSCASVINKDLLKIVCKYIEGPQYTNALKILKLAVTRSSSLAAPPSANQMSMSMYASSMSTSSQYTSSLQSLPADTVSLASESSIADSDHSGRRELPGRTMDFTFDLTQTPIAGRRILFERQNSNANQNDQSMEQGDLKIPVPSSTAKEDDKCEASPRRSLSYNHSFNENSNNWRRPWLSQSRIRERLVGLLTSCGQRVGLPKSPSVIFSQSSEIVERQSSQASSTEEPSATINEMSGDSKLDDVDRQEQFGLFREFDFLEYELESQEGESLDNFNWGVRRRSLSNLSDVDNETRGTISPSHDAASVESSSTRRDELSSDDEAGSTSPISNTSNEYILEDFFNSVMHN